MLKVECEGCKAPYQVDERRVPPTGLKMRCPKCGHSFVVQNPNAPAAAAPPPAAPAAPRVVKVQKTIVGAPPVPMPPPSAPKHEDPDLPAVPSGADLPAAVRPKAPAIHKRTMAGVPPQAVFQVAPQGAKVVPPKLDDLPPLDDLPAIPAPKRDDFDLPAMKADLPATRGGADLPAMKGADLPAFARPAPPLPTAATKKEKAGTMAWGQNPFADLPATVNADLPATVNADLPSPAAVGLPAPATRMGLPGSPGAGLPAKRAGAGGGFGEIDLPSVANDLPSPVQGDLPSRVNDLPAIQNALPAIVSTSAQLPAMTSSDRHLPANTAPDRHLPSAMSAPAPSMGGGDDFGELELPRAPGYGSVVAPLPSGGESFAGPPPPIDDFALPPPQGGSFAGAPPPPPAPFGDASPFTSSPPDAGFGELELPVPPNENPPPSEVPRSTDGNRAGGMTFGELDLGGSEAPGPSGGDNPFGEASLGSVVQPPPSAGSSPPGLADDLDFGGRSGNDQGGILADGRSSVGGEAQIDAPRQARRERSTEVRKPSKVLKVLGAAIVVMIVAGLIMGLVPKYGFFGMNLIGDIKNAGAYAQATNDAIMIARQGFANDSFPEAKAACDKIAAMRAAKPRALSLTTFAALAEFEQELRFGKDGERATRARLWLTNELPESSRASVKYFDAANAILSALEGDDKAKAAIDAAIKKYPGDLIQQDLLFAKGELALHSRDAATANEAFKQLVAVAPNARSHFGLARTAEILGDYDTSTKEIVATMTAFPAHSGALKLRAEVTWARSHEEDAALASLKDLDSLLTGPARLNTSTRSASDAYALRGWIQLTRGITTEATTAFAEAIKLDPRNVSALLGQAEILYNDGRYTEASTRFETAMQIDPASQRAVVGAAKTKIQNERLADAKSQLSEARKKFPKSTLVAAWLAQAEAALGNRPAAEQAFKDAIALADPKDPDAVHAYAMYAIFLSTQGRQDDADQQLADAQKKLPDSASLERALGDVLVLEGKYSQAIDHYQVAQKKAPQDLSTKFHLGQAYRQANRSDEASKVFDELYAVDKEYPNLALERGLLFEQSGDVNKALEQFEAQLKKAPNDPDVRLRVGAAYVVIGKPEEALANLNPVILVKPNSAEANFYKGRALLEQGPLHVIEAMRFLKTAVERDGNRAEYHLYLGWGANLSTPADIGLARVQIEKALELNKNLAEGYWLRGVINNTGGAVDSALRDLRRALELKPTLFDAHAAMAETYEQKNDPNSAAAEWQKAITARPDDPYWNFRFGRLLLDRGNPGEAAKHLKVACETGETMQPRPGWLRQAEFPAAEAMRKSGDTKGAIEHYNAFIRMNDANNPYRKDAMNALTALGAPYQPDLQ